MVDGGIHPSGEPAAVLTAATVERVFGLRSEVITDPVSGRPLMLPVGRHGLRTGTPNAS